MSLSDVVKKLRVGCIEVVEFTINAIYPSRKITYERRNYDDEGNGCRVTDFGGKPANDSWRINYPLEFNKKNN